ncbi:hypothetical protein ZIOFF_061027 [Zingiber officinale]|uniref:Uncharacterized protein n=1 Tax=Zingiber officinale TaxID=94328 RepID=A0A8J5KME6_ZINOF|nr:hypothetical protein ZIOFF_061027 [Zingiber officinale]
MKVEFPRWENNDPIGWISRAEKYFRFHGTSDNAKVDLASINLEGDAIQWYDWLEACHGPPKWEEFKEELINRFGPSGYENVDGELAKIRQTSTVLEYQGRFERLSNRTRDWSEKQLLGTFIEGLRLDIRREVKMNQPRTMKAALSFARLQEEKINEEGRRNNKVIRENPSHYSTPRRLTKEEIKERMAKGLCWHCDEKWHRGHQCKQKRILMIEPIENSEEEDDFYEGETQDNINEVQDDSMAISIHALEGLQTPQIMKVKGFIKKQPVMILIDSGSTNNFLDSTLARRLKQKIERASTFDVKVADGRSLTSPGKCEGIKIILPNYELITDLFFLPLDGCDVVLGAQWLRTLGDIIWNFSQLTMRFQDQGKEVCIRGKRQDTITSISSYQAERLLKKDCSIFLMQLSIKKDPKGTSYTPPELETLLSKFSMIFAEPKGLPPSRSHDHRIPLIPGSAPANVRPYRYPYIQKEVIEKIVQEMLQAGIVRPSMSIYDKEMLAIIHAVTKWRPYLLGRHFQIRTDHKSLKFILDQCISNIDQQKWIKRLLGYDYEIVYKKGTENTVADALSRLPNQIEFTAISLVTCKNLENIKKEQKENSAAQALIQNILQNSSPEPHYSWDGEILRYKNRIFLPANSAEKEVIPEEFHCSLQGILASYARINGFQELLSKE